MHHIYHTHGFVIKSKNTGEANKIITLYTRELGLVQAVAQGIRLSKSKSRFALQDFSYAKVDLVKGRDVWHIGSVETISSFPFARAKKENLFLMTRIFSLINRLCDKEESNEKIFDDISQVLEILDHSEISSENREALELHLVLRIVHSLGYISDSDVLAQYLNENINIGITDSLLSKRRYIVGHINKAFRESHL